MDYFYEDGIWTRKTSPQWEIDMYGFPPNVIGDLLFENAHWAFINQNLQLFTEINLHLEEGKRWPDFMMEGDENKYSKNRIQCWWSRVMVRNGYRETQLFRWQKGMTRDPFNMHYCAALLLELPDYIRLAKPPWYIWRPTFNWWRRYLITGNKFWLKAWEIAELISVTKKTPVFSNYLTAWQAYMVDSTEVKRLIGKHTDTWNYCIRQLIHHPLRYLDEPFIMAYKPRYNFEWQKDMVREPYPNKLIPDPNPDVQYLDLEILMFVHTRNKIMYPGKKGWDPMVAEPTWKERITDLFRTLCPKKEKI